eukprot:CAMPEP_0114248324 /NCGR_PEP_ID=MMETSP0058-20121206/13512_1 /TAXON_ID=36894 /ORGANISM="Pyramimonas parkeae, CCMP726" /LENGTH=85 /DNA_ID=CAMNT_0001361723 /DNA_START=128 /DNA_END=385 /DNA_ORIENTATION=-
MSASADFAFPQNVKKSLTISGVTGPISSNILQLKADCMVFLKEYLESTNVNISEAERDDLFEEKISDDEDDPKASKKERKKARKH